MTKGLQEFRQRGAVPLFRSVGANNLDIFDTGRASASMVTIYPDQATCDAGQQRREQLWTKGVDQGVRNGTGGVVLGSRTTDVVFAGY